LFEVASLKKILSIIMPSGVVDGTDHGIQDNHPETSPPENGRGLILHLVIREGEV